MDSTNLLRMTERALASSTLVLSLLLGACSGSDEKKADADPQPATVVWSTTDGGNDHSYRLVTVKNGITWPAAEAAAAAAGGHLATIATDLENSFVADLAAAHANAWLLITPDAAPGTFLGPWLGASAESARFTWVTNEAWSYTAWASGEPTGTYNGNVEDKLILKGATDGAGVFEVSGWNDAGDFAGPSYVIELE